VSVISNVYPHSVIHAVLDTAQALVQKLPVD
jgi:hypothetical protein